MCCLNGDVHLCGNLFDLYAVVSVGLIIQMFVAKSLTAYWNRSPSLQVITSCVRDVVFTCRWW